MVVGRKKTRTKGHLSGHGNVHFRKLSTAMLKKIHKTGRATLTISGVKKTITTCNLKRGGIEWYKRSDTRKPAVRNYCKDYSGSKAGGRNVKRRGMEGDTRYVKSKNGWI